MDNLFEKCTTRVSARITETDKKAIAEFRKARGLTESEYIKLAIKNLLNEDEYITHRKYIYQP